MTTAAIPEAKLVISTPGITWLANNTANPVIAHRIRNPFMPASYRPCGRGLKPPLPHGTGNRFWKGNCLTQGERALEQDNFPHKVQGRTTVSEEKIKQPTMPIGISPLPKFLSAPSLRLASVCFSSPLIRRRNFVLGPM